MHPFLPPFSILLSCDKSSELPSRKEVAQKGCPSKIGSS
jgi:hypothetical protein